MSTLNFRDFLATELQERRDRNRTYSLRAFARDLGISATSLSQVLNSKRELSLKNAYKVADSLKIAPTTLYELLKQHSRYDIEGHNDKHVLDHDSFNPFANWQVGAVCQLAQLKENSSDSGWIANRLGVTIKEAEEVRNWLESHEMIELVDKKMVRTLKPITTTKEISSMALKNFHASMLEKAKECLYSVPLELRDVVGMMLTLDPEKLPKAKKAINDFRRKLTDIMEADEAKEVYYLAIQLYPITKPSTQRKENELLH